MPATKANRLSSKQLKPKADSSVAHLKKISEGSSQIVKEAASLLDDELAAGILTAKQMQERFQKERRIDAGDFRETLERLRTEAHEAVNQLNSKISEASSKENVQLLQRLVNNGHDLLDLAAEMLNTGAELADQLAQSDLLKKKNGKPK
jgi:uncharacterized membrane protein YccC